MLVQLLLIFQSTLFSTMVTFEDMNELGNLFAEQLEISCNNMEDEQKSIASTSESDNDTNSSDDDASSSDDESTQGPCKFLKYRVIRGGMLVDEYVIRRVGNEILQSLNFKDPKVLIEEVINRIPTSAVFKQFITFCNRRFMVGEDQNIFNKSGELWKKISELSKAGQTCVSKDEALKAIKNLFTVHPSYKDVVDGVAMLILYYCHPNVRFRRQIFEPEQNFFPRMEMHRMFVCQELNKTDGWNLTKIEFCNADCPCNFIFKKYSSVLITQQLRATLVLKYVAEVLTFKELR